jgi:hypothetical protein
MRFKPLRPVVWNGELVALAGRERFHIVAPRLRDGAVRVADIEYVSLLCLYHRQVLAGALPCSADPTLPERWADAVLELRRRTISD